MKGTIGAVCLGTAMAVALCATSVRAETITVTRIKTSSPDPLGSLDG